MRKSEAVLIILAAIPAISIVVGWLSPIKSIKGTIGNDIRNYTRDEVRTSSDIGKCTSSLYRYRPNLWSPVA